MSATASGLILREIRPEDATALCRIANMPGYRRGTLRMPFETPEAWRTRIAATGPDVTWIIAETGGEIVGSATLFAAGSSPRTAHAASLGMGVADHHVGKGIGTALLEALLDVADNWRNIRRVQLEVVADNEPAIHLYRAHGFEEEGRRRKAVFLDGAFVDTLAMARLTF